MFCPIRAHKPLHGLYKLSFVVGELHIDEISHDDTAEIPEPELAGNFFCSLQIRFKSVLFLIIAYTFITAVYIYYVQGFCMLNDQISSAGQIDGFSKCGFDLFGNTKMVK